MAVAQEVERVDLCCPHVEDAEPQVVPNGQASCCLIINHFYLNYTLLETLYTDTLSLSKGLTRPAVSPCYQSLC